MLAFSLLEPMSRLTNLAPRVQPLTSRLGARAAVKRITGRRLQHIRAMHFAQDPLCVECIAEGHVEAAVDLDHRIALVNGGDEHPSNRQGLCKRHHDAKTQRDLAIAKGTAEGVA